MKLIKKLYQKYTKNFIKYLIIGIAWACLNIFFMWFFIEIILFSTIIGATIVVVGLFISKFYAYRLIRLINKQFLKYASTSISFALSNIVLIWFFVDILHIPIVISSTIIVCALFILRFVAFDKAGLIKK